MRQSEAPENGAIMAIRYEDQSTVKRVRIRGNRVFLCWEDGSQRFLEVDSDEYEIQGKFISIVRNPKKKG
ncbi:hypothetical protein FACS189447_01640 [Spirochaetia bacterium]|nr:hypothetical protein FACS189447_01640 [Spirochaetia bacterium]